MGTKRKVLEVMKEALTERMAVLERELGAVEERITLVAGERAAIQDKKESCVEAIVSVDKQLYPGRRFGKTTPKATKSAETAITHFDPRMFKAIGKVKRYGVVHNVYQEVLDDVLAVMRTIGEWAASSTVAGELRSYNRDAIDLHLRYMKKEGMVKRRKFGHGYAYKIAAKAPKAVLIRVA